MWDCTQAFPYFSMYAWEKSCIATRLGNVGNRHTCMQPTADHIRKSGTGIILWYMSLQITEGRPTILSPTESGVEKYVWRVMSSCLWSEAQVSSSRIQWRSGWDPWQSWSRWWITHLEGYHWWWRMESRCKGELENWWSSKSRIESSETWASCKSTSDRRGEQWPSVCTSYS